MRHLAVALLFALASWQTAFAQANISASILPGARSVEVGTPATAFAAITNGGNETAFNCRLELFSEGSGAIDAVFSYQTTTPLNELSGTPNTPGDIPAGQTQNFLFTLIPNSSFDAEAIIDFVCDAGVRAVYREGLTTFGLSAGTAPPDILAIGSTLSGDGVVRVSSPNGFIPFAVSAINIGGSGIAPDRDSPFAGANEAEITVRVEPSSISLPVGHDICVANSSAQCISPRGSQVTTQIGDAPSFFVIRALGQGFGVPFFPDIVRFNVIFDDAGGVERGRTSVAVLVDGPPIESGNFYWPSGIWNIDIDGAGLEFGEVAQGIVVIDAVGVLTAFAEGHRFGQRTGEYGFFGEIGSDYTSVPDPTIGGVVREVIDNQTLDNFSDVQGRWRPSNYVRFPIVPRTGSADPAISGPAWLPERNRRLRGTHSDLTRRPTTLASLEGNYDLLDEDNDEIRDIGDIFVNASGGISGTLIDGDVTVCTVTGSFHQPDSEENIFQLSLSLSGAGCRFEGTYSGHAAQFDDETRGISDAIAMIFTGQNTAVNTELVRFGQGN